MNSAPRSFSGHGVAHGRLIQVVAADLGVLVDQYGNQQAPALLERGVGVDVDRAHGDAEFGCKRRETTGHLLAEVAIGAVIKKDLHAPQDIRKGGGALKGAAARKEWA